MKSALLSSASLVVPNQQILVNMVSQRVRQLTFGARPLVQMPPGTGSADIALTEIIEKKLSYAALAPEELAKPNVIAFASPKPKAIRRKAAA